MSNDATDSLRSQFVTLKNGQGQHSKYIWVNIEKGQSYRNFALFDLCHYYLKNCLWMYVYKTIIDFRRLLSFVYLVQTYKFVVQI